MMKSWFDWRATVLALVLAVASALPFMTTSVVRRDYYLFDITLTSTAPGTTQLFWDLGHGYNENDSSRQPLKIEPKPVRYRYMMPMGDIKALRLDPTDGVGVFYFSHAQIVDSRNHIVRKFGPDDFKASSQIARMEKQGDTLRVETEPNARDAILEIQLREPLHLPSGPRIWLRLGLPVALPVFVLGLILGCPRLTPRYQRLVAAVAGWMRARPRRAIAVMATLAVAVQCHPILFQGRSFASPDAGSFMLYGRLPTLPGVKEQDRIAMDTMGSDTGALLFNHLYYPMIQRDALLKHGEWPLWNRNSLGGEPLLGQGQSMFGDPFNFLTIFADSAAWAWDVRFLVAHWLFAAGLGFITWRLTRHLAASLLVTLGSVFVGFFTYRLIHPANFSVCYSPWILWAWAGLVHATTSRRQAGWLAALVASNWLVFTSGTVKEAYMAMACLNLAGVILLWLLPVARGQRWRIFGFAAVAGGIFVLLSAPGWMSFLVSLRHSFTGYDQPVANTLPVTQVIGFFDDIFYRQATADETVVAPALNFFLLLGVAWWLVNPRLWREDRAGLAMVLGAVVPFALAFGFVPAALIVKLPFIGNIHHLGDTFSCPLMVVGAVLAGCGFRDALERLRGGGRWEHLNWVFVLSAGLIVMFFLATRGQVTSAFFAGYMPALALGIVALPMGVRWAFQYSRPGLLYVAVAIGLPLLLWRHCQFGKSFFNHYAFVPGLRCDLHAPSPGVAYVDELKREPGRIVGWGSALYPSYNSALRWESLYGVDALRNRYYQELASAFDMRRVWIWDWTNNGEDAARLVPAHNLMNVTYSVADHADPAREFPGVQLVTQLDLDIYASPKAWPRAFFTDRMATYATAPDFARQVLSGDGRPFAARQNDEQDLPVLSSDVASRTVRPATDYHLTSNNTSFTVDATGPGVAVLTETYYAEDFQVTVDGKRVPYFRVNHAFKGVAITSAGRHEITFAYWPLHFTLALALAGAGLLLFIVGFGWLWRTDPVALTGETSA